MVAFLLFLAPNVTLAEPMTIVVLGDSLVAGYGLPQADGLVPRLGEWLEREGEEVALVNAGVSGDTTAMGRSRLDWSLGEGADAVILALGANDMLRGVDPSETRANLDAMMTALNERGIPVLLAGMRASGNLGETYVASFDRIYPDLAEKHGTLLYPFLLNGVALDPAKNQRDGIHPNAMGVEVIIEGLGPVVRRLVRSVAEQGG